MRLTFSILAAVAAGTLIWVTEGLLAWDMGGAVLAINTAAFLLIAIFGSKQAAGSPGVCESAARKIVLLDGLSSGCFEYDANDNAWVAAVDVSGGIIGVTVYASRGGPPEGAIQHMRRVLPIIASEAWSKEFFAEEARVYGGGWGGRGDDIEAVKRLRAEELIYDIDKGGSFAAELIACDPQAGENATRIWICVVDSEGPVQGSLGFDG